MAAELPTFPTASLYLPGTVALPSPFPTLGTVWLPPEDFANLPDLPKGTVLVAIQATARPHTTIVRYVRADLIAAIFVLKKPSAEESVVNWKDGDWHYAPDVDCLRKQILVAPRQAIVYLPENAPVMTQSVFGATAAESAEHLGHLWGCD
jgi:hypothetical protein